MKNKHGKSAKKSKPASNSAKKSTRRPAAAKTRTLHYRPREDHDDSFIARITLLTLKDIFENSTQSPLTSEIVLRLVKQTDHCVIIEQQGKPIGYYCYDKTADDRIYWGSLVIEPAMQTQGLGNQVFEHFVADMRKQGIRYIDGHVQVKNEKAYNYWLKKGFQVIGREQNGSVPIRLTLTEP